VDEQKADMRDKLLKIAADVCVSNSRTQAAATVFQPSHILPTYSVEQFGMIELRQARRFTCLHVPSR